MNTLALMRGSADWLEMTTWPRSTPKSLHSTPLPGAWKAGREPGVPGGGINGRWACSVDLHAYDPEAFNEICMKNYFHSRFSAF